MSDRENDETLVRQTISRLLDRLKLRGIAYSYDRPSAVIGTTIAHEDDVVLGATVVGISRGGVEFEVNGETWTQKVQ